MNTAAEYLVHFHIELEAHKAAMKESGIKHDKEIAEIRELQNAFAAGMIRLQEKSIQNEDAHAKFEAGMGEIRELHRDTEAKLNSLIETVDSIIRKRKRDK